MRVGIGAAVIVLILALVSLGYLLYGYIDTSEKLNIAQQEIVKIRQENQELQEMLNTANTEIETLKSQKAELEQQILVQQEQVRQLEEQNRILEEQNNALEQQKQALDKENTELKAQIIAGKTEVPIVPKTTQKITNSLSPALFVPILPIAIVATYAATRQRLKNSIQKNQGTRVNNTEGRNMVMLSDNELKEVIQMRRGQ